MSGATPTTRAVFDASVVLRASLARAPQATEWLRRLARLEVRVHVPELVFAELVHALRRQVSARIVSSVDAQAVLAGFGGLPLRVHRHAPFAAEALERSLALGINGYDAFYVVLAEATDAVLVTADRRLAEAYDRVELLA